MTNDLSRRIYEHKTKTGGAFTRRYNLDKLAYYERFDDPANAIQREKTMKRWPRQWKLNAIIERNPDWADLYDTLNH